MESFYSARTVTILRPYGTSISQLMELQEDEHRNPMDLIEAERIDETIDTMREIIGRIAERLHLALQVYEYNVTSENNTPSRSATKWIRESNVIMTVDPTDAQLSFIIECMRSNPTMAALLTCHEVQLLEERFHILATQTVPIFERHAVSKAQSRIFAATPKIIDSAAEKVLIYPLKAI